MKITFIGTGAADYDWKRYGEPGVMGSTATLIDDVLLVDCGPTVPAGFRKYGQDMDKVSHILNTHSHEDHFDAEAVRQLCSGREVCFYGTPAACCQLEGICRTFPVCSGDCFEAGDFKVTVLPANHTVRDLKEETFLFIIEKAGANLFYALDTSWLTGKAEAILGRRYIHGAIWDGTMSAPGDWRIFTHSDPDMISQQRKVLMQNGCMDENTVIWLDHRARTLWPQDMAEQQKIADAYHLRLAVEGESCIL